MKWLWTWSGSCFGYRDGNDLWTHDGRHVGKFYDSEVYDATGNYLGELRGESRLITNSSKTGRRKPPFARRGSRGAYSRYSPYAAYAMYAGYTEFPDADAL
jgi:hypothetical protein